MSEMMAAIEFDQYQALSKTWSVMIDIEADRR